MKYYLDTVTTRRLAKYFDRMFIRENCFVSIHVISELLTDLNKDNFFIKKNTLNKIFENNIIIDWDQPHKKQYESFGFFNLIYKLNKDNVLFFYEKIKKADSLDDFYNSIDKYIDEYNKIQNYDDSFESYFRGEMDAKIDDLKKAFPYSQAISICDQMILYIKSSEEGFVNFLAVMYVKMAEDLYNSEMNKYQKRTIEEIIKSYNGQIDIFLAVSGIYVLNKVPRKQQIAKNDFNDMYHLVYVNDNVIVSDDTLFEKYMKEIFPDRIISCDNFMILNNLC